jgi:hypothetical protein
MADDGQPVCHAILSGRAQHPAVIDVVLQFQVGQLQSGDDLHRQVEAVHQIAGNILAVDRLDQDVEIGRGFARKAQRVFISGQRFWAGGDTRHHMQPGRGGGACVFQRGGEGGAEITVPPGQRRQPALARREISRRGVEQHLLQAMLRQLRRDGVRPRVIGKEIFHRREAGIRRRREAVQKIPFGEQPGEVGGKARHGPSIALFKQRRNR